MILISFRYISISIWLEDIQLSDSFSNTLKLF